METKIPSIIPYIKKKYVDNNNKNNTNNPLFTTGASISLTDLFDNPSSIISTKIPIKSKIDLDQWLACIIIKKTPGLFNKPDLLMNRLTDKVGGDIYRVDEINIDIRDNDRKKILEIIERDGRKMLRNRDTDKNDHNTRNVSIFDKYITDIIPSITPDNLWTINILLLQNIFNLLDSAIATWLAQYNIEISQTTNSKTDKKIYTINLSDPTNIYIDITQVLTFNFKDNDNKENGESSLSYTLRFYINTARVYLSKMLFDKNFGSKLVLKEHVTSSISKIQTVIEPVGIVEKDKEKIPLIFDDISKLWYSKSGDDTALVNATVGILTKPDNIKILSKIASPVIKYDTMGNRSFVIGYTVKVRSDEKGKKSCIFGIPDGKFDKIGKQLKEIAASKQDPEKQQILALIKNIGEERSYCKHSGSWNPLARTFSLFKKKGGRRTRKHVCKPSCIHNQRNNKIQKKTQKRRTKKTQKQRKQRK